VDMLNASGDSNYEISMTNEAVGSMGQTNIGNKSYAPKHCMWYLHTRLSTAANSGTMQPRGHQESTAGLDT